MGHSAFIAQYFAALERSATGDELARFYTEDVVQVELPNRLNPNGGRSDLATLLARSAMVSTLLRRQRYEIASILVDGDRVAIEATWSAELAVPLGTLAPGDSMNASFAIFVEMRDGRIAAQRNYDCFEPW